MLALLVYLLVGLGLAGLVLPRESKPRQLWLGLVFGCVLLMWLPCLFAFFLGFTMAAQLAALSLAFTLLLVCAFLLFRKRKSLGPAEGERGWSKSAYVGLGVSLLLTAFCAWLLHTHVLLPRADGGLWVGQSTYGDLAMHLGFIESLFQQGVFPPEYSIFPGQQLNYPFLVDAASAGLRFFGLSLRGSVIAPSLVMLFCVFWGFWQLAEKITGRLAPALAAWLLFFFNGGFGFALFLGKYPFSSIFTGYYTTPTNFAAEDIRWVNVVCDMLIPQRTTMAGWCVLLAALWLLLTALEKSRTGEGRREILVLAALASSLPMIHTHSFLALGILSAVWFFCALPEARRLHSLPTLVGNYVCYGLICLLLAAPQILKWTMDSVNTGNLLHLHLGWIAGSGKQIRSWPWFYIVNCGVVFLAILPAFFCLRGEKKRLLVGPLAIFLLANLVAFQPNLYDNNKLLYVWFMLTDILVCDWLFAALGALKKRAVRAAFAGLFVAFGCLSGLLSLGRESVSAYRLISPEEKAAAEFLLKTSETDSVILTGCHHDNAVSVLTGRSIVCGPSIYLFYHGVNYREREEQVAEMYGGGEAFLRGAAEYGVDYVYIGPHERGSFAVNENWFSARYPKVFDNGSVRIYEIDPDT